MYELKTLLPQFDIKLPTCMYELKNVSLASNACNEIESSGHASIDSNGATLTPGAIFTTTATASAKTNGDTAPLSYSKRACPLDLDVLGEQIRHILKANDNVSAITQRQEKVLQQLNELKEQLAGIRSSLFVCGKNIKHITPQKVLNGGLKEEPLHDIVINGHPNFIPYALLALKNAWKDLFIIDVRIFSHSTVPEIGPEALEFEKKLKEVEVDITKPKINVTLIWTDCEHTEMISSPTMYVPIYGEVNIIRYLGRVGPAEYRYEDSPFCNDIDAVLDICYQLLRCNTNKGRAGLLRSLSNRLNKQKYFGGEEFSIADIGVHSSLKRMTAITDKELTPALREWQKRAKLITKI